MVDFKKLLAQKSSLADVAEIVKRSETKKSYKDDRYWMPTLDKNR